MTWASWWPWLEPWSSVFLAALVWFVAWKAAIAWYKTRGAIVKVSELEPNDGGVFTMRVQNAGDGEVTAHVYAKELRGSARIRPQVEVHWQDTDAGVLMRLAGEKIGWACILRAEECAGGPCVFVAALGQGKQMGRLPLCDPVPIDQQREEMHLILRIVFEDENGKFLKDKIREIVITPDAAARFKYRVESVRKWF